jgi:hypothetical protein
VPTLLDDALRPILDQGKKAESLLHQLAGGIKPDATLLDEIFTDLQEHKSEILKVLQRHAKSAESPREKPRSPVEQASQGR